MRAALKAHSETTRLNVKIICRAGHVELAGMVESAEGREAAAGVAAAQPGVLAVDNRLTIRKFPKW